jgi:hypothetical protein
MEPFELGDPGQGLVRSSGIVAIEQAVLEWAEAGKLGPWSSDELALIWHGVWSLVHGMALLERVHPHHEELFRAHARDLVRAYLRGFTMPWMGSDQVETVEGEAPPARSASTTGEKRRSGGPPGRRRRQ